MAITQALCTSFKVELLTGLHDFTASTGNTFKVALVGSGDASLDSTSTNYSDIGADESSGTGYTAGGNTLTNITPTSSGTTAYLDFSDTTWTSATFTAYGAMIYNASASNRAVCVISFSGAKSVSNGTFSIVFPTADASNAIIRIA